MAKSKVYTLIKMKPLKQTPAWQALEKHHGEICDLPIQDNMLACPTLLSACGINLEYSRHRLTKETITLLLKLAKEADLPAQLHALFAGDIVNHTENRPALHTALRDLSGKPIIVNGHHVTADIQKTRERLTNFVNQVQQGNLCGATKKPFRHIVNIGIGGSHTGPMMTIEALKDFAINKLQFHFISTVDPDLIRDVLEIIDPETTLFIISSKSFTTIETLSNAKTALTFMQARLGSDAIKQHFVALTAQPERARELGIMDERIFPLWEWVGGRYSIWSAIGLPLMLMIGPEQFTDFLKGAYEMDQHVLQAPLESNLPVLLAMLGIWYVSFFHIPVQAIIPYSYRLRFLVPYLQQAMMESNGKCVTRSGHPVSGLTSPVIIGQEGCEGQHTYHQLLHQGTGFIPVDFILVKEAHQASDQEAHDLVIASALSQAEALRAGKTAAQAESALSQRMPAEQAKQLAPHCAIPGNKPSSMLTLDQLNPATLGALLALYEHLIFIQGTIWDINSFDQWGVELGKELLPVMLSHIQSSRQRKAT